MWKRLDGRFDVVIIGGGINGAGIARDTARRGLRVALIEMRDLAFGTSSRSSKLVHGGLRYLEQFAFHLVFESVSERRLLLDLAPHLVNPLGFLFPVYRHSRTGIFKLNAGMWLYDGLSLFRSPKKRRNLKKKDVIAEEPALKVDDLTGAPLYYDCSTDDARLTLESALDAADHGAVITTWARVESFLYDNEAQLSGVVVRDAFTGEARTIEAGVVINATGPWTDQIHRMARGDETPRLLRPTKGVHFVVRHEVLPVRNAVVVIHPTDQRVMFAIPWGDSTYVGTTDTDFSGDPAEVHADASDIAYLIDACRAYFPEHPVRPSDIHCTWAGLRPLVAPSGPDGELDESAVSREHSIEVGRDGLVTVAGGKLTTYRKMSAEVVEHALGVLRMRGRLPSELRGARTDRDPLPGAVGWPANDDHEAVAREVCELSQGALSIETARLLADNYGMVAHELARRVAADPGLAAPLQAGRPEVLVQVDWAVEQELCCTLSDMLKQRTQLFYRALDQGLASMDTAGTRMAALLGWSELELHRQRQAYEKDVADSRRWQAGYDAWRDAESADAPAAAPATP